MLSNLELESWQRLKDKVAPEVLQAPKTGGEPNGNWEPLHSKTVDYLEKKIVGKPWANHFVLIAAIMSARHLDVWTIKNNLTCLDCRFSKLFIELGLKSMSEWKGEKHIISYLKRELVPKDSARTRTSFWNIYNTASKLVSNWFWSLSEIDKQIYQQFVMPVVNYERVANFINYRQIKEETQQKRKTETDALLPHYSQLRAEAHFRYNKIVRLYEKWQEVQEIIKQRQEDFPFTFSYKEQQEQLHFRKWNRRSFVLAYQDKYSKITVDSAKQKTEAFSDERENIFLEFVKTERLADNSLPEGFWFEDLIKQGVLRHSGLRSTSGKDSLIQRQKWLRTWGYGEENSTQQVSPFRASVIGLLSWGKAEDKFIYKAQTRAEGIFIPVESFYAAATFGLLGIDILTTTGMRINEAMQIRLSDDCWVRLQIPPSGENKSPTFRYLFRLIPKGERTNTPHNYYIGESTKRILTKVARMLEKHYNIDLKKAEKIPAIECRRFHPRAHRFSKAPYLFQYNHTHLSDQDITSCMRFLLHGIVFKTRDAKLVVIKNHLLRHAFATHAVQVEKVPVDIVGAWLHQKNLDVTEYYSQPTESMISDAADFYLARLAMHINVGESILRSPSELEQQYTEARKRLGTLNQVNGGDCTFNGFCPHGFSCNGCIHKVPNPSKRYQVEQKLEWAKIMLNFCEQEGLFPDAERMKQLIRNCEAELREMDLIEEYQEDEKCDAQLRIEEH